MVYTTSYSGSAYFVLVEPVYDTNKHPDKTVMGKMDEMVEDDNFPKYKTESSKGYTAAKLYKVDREFEVGNGETVGGYYNAPLNNGQSYIFYYGVEVRRGKVR